MKNVVLQKKPDTGNFCISEKPCRGSLIPATIALAGVVLGFSLVAAERGDTLIHLSFDDTVDSIGAASGSTTIYSGTPTYAADTPLSKVYWRDVGGVQQSRDNTKSLRANGSQIRLKFSKATFADLYEVKSATIEFFFKGESLSGTWCSPMRFASNPATPTTPPFPFLFQTDGDNKDYFRVDSSLAGGVATKSLSIYSGKSFADNSWHHFAATISERENGKSAVTFYYDYMPIYEKVTEEGYAWSGFVDGMTVDFGDAKAVFCIDEFRICAGVLSPGEFLTSADREELVRMSFDGNLTSTGRADLQPTLVAGTCKYASDGFAKNVVTTFGGNTKERENGGALCVDGGITLQLPDSLWLRAGTLSSATIEMYLKGTSSKEWGVPFKLYADSNPAQPPFALLVQSNGQGRPNVRLDAFNPSSPTTVESKTASGLYAFNDGQWHHLAVTIAPSSEGHSTYTWYLDGAQVATETTSQYAWQGLTGGRKMLFDGAADFTYWIDELRISKGVLSPDEFIMSSRDEIIYLPFDGNLTSTGRSDCQPVLSSGTAQYASRGFSPNIITAFGGNTNVHVNGGCLYVDNNITLGIPDSPWICGRNMEAATIEFFLKGSADMKKDWQCPIKFKHNSNAAQPPFPLLAQTSETGVLSINLQAFDFTPETVWNITEYDNYKASNLYPLYDAKWHHIVITVEPDGNGMSTFTWFVDGEQKTQVTSSRYNWKGLTGMRQVLFEGNANFKYWVDEFRLIRGVLDPSEFIKKVPSGLILVVR